MSAYLHTNVDKDQVAAYGLFSDGRNSTCGILGYCVVL